jgi:Tol biopolymer transport system component
MRLRLLFMNAILAASACAPTHTSPNKPVLYVYRLDPPAFLELDTAWKQVREIPFVIPQGCDLGGVHAAPRGPRLAIELACPFGPAVLFLDVQTGTVGQPITDSDSHFLAWEPDGQAIYLRINSINRPRIIRLALAGDQDEVPVSELTYDLAPAPAGDEFLYALSRGMGLGSEMWLARRNGRVIQQLSSDPSNYLALARWSPDGERIAFIRIPDSATPFTLGELWVMRANGAGARRLGSADAGHGFAPAWSPDGDRIAFVARENAADPSADMFSDALVSNIHMVSLKGGDAVPITSLRGARVEAPVWKPDGDVILFTARLDDRMTMYVVDLLAGTLQPIPIESICCAAWLHE